MDFHASLQKKKKKMKKCKMYLSIRNLIKSNETDFFECCPFQSYFLMSLWKQNKMTYVWEELLNIKMEKTFVRGKENYSLSEKKWTWRIGWKMLIVLPEDFVRKVKDPQLIPVGRSRDFQYLCDPVYITFIFSWTVLIIKIFHQMMIFNCCVRYFHKRKK